MHNYGVLVKSFATLCQFWFCKVVQEKSLLLDGTAATQAIKEACLPEEKGLSYKDLLFFEKVS